VVIGQQPRVHAFAHPPQQRSGALDIGKQERQGPRAHQLPEFAWPAGQGGIRPQHPADCRAPRAYLFRRQYLRGWYSPAGRRDERFARLTVQAQRPG